MAFNRASSCFNVLRLCLLRRKISERVLQIPQSKANIVKMKTEIVQGSTEVQPTIDEWRVYASIRIGGKNITLFGWANVHDTHTISIV